jgi:hypothetical protein
MAILKQYARIGKKGQKVFNEYGTPYTQDTKGPRIGVMVAIDADHIGWSLISPKERFDETLSEKVIITTPKGKKEITKQVPVWNTKRIWEFGTRLAIERATGEVPQPKIIPRAIEQNLQKFKKRAKAYFKQI